MPVAKRRPGVSLRVAAFLLFAILDCAARAQAPTVLAAASHKDGLDEVAY